MNNVNGQMPARLKTRNSEGGLIIVLVAVVTAFVLVLFAGLVLYSGYTAVDKSQLQNVANLAALGVLEEFTETTGSYSEKSAAALRKANSLAQDNKLKSSSDGISALTLTSAGSTDPGDDARVTFGLWSTEAPDDGTNPCHDNYPCFTPKFDTSANAVRVRTCNQNHSNPMLMPFVNASTFKCVDATAAFVERCIVFLVDTSLSTSFDTHFSTILRDIQPPETPAVVMEVPPGGSVAVPRIRKPRMNDYQPWDPSTNPSLAALPVYQEAAITAAGNCKDPASFKPQTNPSYWLESTFWCSMETTRPPYVANNPRVHYQNDYHSANYHYWNSGSNSWQDVSVRYDGLSQTGYFAPQPFGNIFLAMNVALRTLAKQKTGSDKVALIGFNRNIVTKIPTSGMATNMDDLIRISNLDNRGTFNAVGGELAPRLAGKSVLDYGLLPLFTPAMSQTNVPLAIDVAMDVMKRECKPTSRKSIVLFSDGLSSCSRQYNNSGSSTFEASIEGVSVASLHDRNVRYTCGDPKVAPGTSTSEYAHYNASEIQLRGAYAGDTNSILFALQEAGISLNTMIAGNIVAPSELNRLNYDDWVNHRTPKLNFLSQADASQLGLGKSFKSPGSSWKDEYFPALYYFPLFWWYKDNDPAANAYLPARPSYCPDLATCACANLPRPGFFCGRPNKLFGEMAMDTGGLHCPLRPKCKGADPTGNSCSVDNKTNQCSMDEILSWPTAYDSTQCQVFGFYDNNGVLREQCRGLQTLKNLYQNGASSWNPSLGIWQQHVQTCSPTNESKSEQAARCAKDVVGGNPYVLVEDRTFGNN